jgi:methionyl-tRNA formyltransferase
MSKSNKLIFFGTEDFSAPSLEALLQADWTICAVVTKPDRPAGRGQKMHVPKVKQIAQARQIDVLQPENVREANAKLLEYGASAGILVAYGKILPQSTIELFPAGIINVHPSLLPKYRGPAPIEAAILNGDNKTGISLMELTQAMDAGPVYYQHRVDLNGNESRLLLLASLAKEGAEILRRQLQPILSGELKAIVQDDNSASYTKLITKEDGWIDWQEPAELIERKVRAYEGFPKARAKIFGKYEVVIKKVQVVESSAPDKLVVECQPGWLEILELIAPSGRSISGAEFLRGYKI